MPSAYESNPPRREVRAQHLRPVRPENRPDARNKDWSEVDQIISEMEREANRLRPPYHETLLPEGELVLVQKDRFALINVVGVWKWVEIMLIADDGTQGEWGGREILLAYNVPRPGWIAPNHNVARDFFSVTGLKAPPVPRWDKSDPKNSGPKDSGRVGKLYLDSFLKGVQVECHTTQVRGYRDRKTNREIQRPESQWYSRIDRIVSRTAGCPRVLMSRG